MKRDQWFILGILIILMLFISGCIQETGSIIKEETQEQELSEELPEEIPCVEDWKCTSFGECSAEGKQTRTCMDIKDCGTTENKPTTTRTCTPPVVEEPAPTSDPCVSIGCPEGTQYVGSKKSDKYHYCTCRWAKEIYKENLICFTSVADAQSKGYVACKVCHPPS